MFPVLFFFEVFLSFGMSTLFPSLEHMLGRSGVDGQNKTLKKASYVDISKPTQALTKKGKV